MTVTKGRRRSFLMNDVSEVRDKRFSEVMVEEPVEMSVEDMSRKSLEDML